MAGHPLYVGFLWHMHQPDYRNSVTGEVWLPWIRLHAAKDYLHMPRLAAGFPGLKVTFNLTPVLLSQLEDYAAGRTTDRAEILSLKDPAELTPAEKREILGLFFSIDPDRVIRRYPRYARLYELKPEAEKDPDLFSAAYWRDLQAWFNLAWISPDQVEADPELAALVARGRDFTGDDVRLILAKHREFARQVIAAYRALVEAGQAEISTSPFYHPILPLLIDSRSARRASPNLPLPEPSIAWPEDAFEQLRLAVSFIERIFGQPPAGLWPSEGAVSPETVELAARFENLRWLATDEGILVRSLGTWVERDGDGNAVNPEILCRPYAVRTATGRKLAVFFRDQVLSDRIGFVYRHFSGVDAARDLYGRLKTLRGRLPPDRPFIVTIALDGENCWEGYEDNGNPFLRTLYRLLTEDPELKPVTFSEYLASFEPEIELERLHTGSWIGANLETWVGEPAQNRAWEYLARTRSEFLEVQAASPGMDHELLAGAWRSIYTAEGSDWFWWYYSRHDPGPDNPFDRAFRSHLASVYLLTGRPVPGWLLEPIRREPVRPASRPPVSYVSPPLDAVEPAGHAWSGAGWLEPPLEPTTMRPALVVFRRVIYGYDPTALHIRVETQPPVRDYEFLVLFRLPGRPAARILPDGSSVDWAGIPPGTGFSAVLLVQPARPGVDLYLAGDDGSWQPGDGGVRLGIDRRVAELAVAFDSLGIGLGARLEALFVARRGPFALEVLPAAGLLTMDLRPF